MRPCAPLSVRLLFTALVLAVEIAMVPAFGAQHLLWFSHLALIGSVVVLWTGWRLLASMLAVAVVIPEIGWTLDFLVGLGFGESVTGATAYMFDPQRDLLLRVASLFHLLLPPLILWEVRTLGYDPRAFAAQTLVAWIILPIAFSFGARFNINWTHGPGIDQQWVGDGAYLALWMVTYPLLVHLPAHLLLRRWRTRTKRP